LLGKLGLSAARPSAVKLSGGEQQRVAVARAPAIARRWCWQTNRPATSTGYR
jgi:predicted ABC-type transport system involved in lysophospholipase L1 biosynthesis ATPase subunit